MANIVNFESEGYKHMCTNFSVPTPTILVSEMTEKKSDQIHYVRLKNCTSLNENPSNFYPFLWGLATYEYNLEYHNRVKTYQRSDE